MELHINGILFENPLPVGSYAWHDQYDDELFPGIRKSSKIADHYGSEKCGTIYSGSHPFKLLWKTERRDCGATRRRNSFNDDLHIYVYHRYAFRQQLAGILWRAKINPPF